jgi:hypothetical protein
MKSPRPTKLITVSSRHESSRKWTAVVHSGQYRASVAINEEHALPVSVLHIRVYSIPPQRRHWGKLSFSGTFSVDMCVWELAWIILVVDVLFVVDIFIFIVIL